MDWIDVNKSLPNNKQRVGEGFWELDDLNGELFFVTHWQPLPEPPLAEK